MAYWWASQQELFGEQRKEDCLWAPRQVNGGASFFHWRNMTEVVPGDVIFSYANRSFAAVSVAKTEAVESDDQVGRRAVDWGTQGRRIDVEYLDMETFAPLDQVHKLLAPMLPEEQAPLRRDGRDREGYLFGLPSEAGRLLLDYLASQVGLVGKEAISSMVIAAAGNPLERQALAASRLGQGVFRKAVSKVWKGRCVVTGANARALVKAIHIKPWQDSNNEERLDPYNGLMLSALYTEAFNTGLISFDLTGSLLLSESVEPFQWEQLGIKQTSWIAGLKEEHAPYLEYHRDHVFAG
jgi:hypothetical protein